MESARKPQDAKAGRITLADHLEACHAYSQQLQWRDTRYRIACTALFSYLESTTEPIAPALRHQLQLFRDVVEVKAA